MQIGLIRRLYPIALVHFAVELCYNYLPVVYPTLIVTMGLSYAQVGFITLFGSAGATLIQPLFGYLSDRWETRRIIVFSIMWIGVLMGLVGLARGYSLLVLLVGLGSLGSAAFHPAGATAVAYVATRRRGATLSVFSVSGTLGTALSPLLMTAAMGWLGLSGTIVLVPIALLIGWFLYRQEGWGGDSFAGSVPSGLEMGKSEPRVPNGSLLGLLLVVLMVMCRSWFQVGLVTYLPEWLQGQGWSPPRSGQMLTVLLVSISLGTVIGGTLSDRIGRWQVLALSLGLLGPVQWVFVSSARAPEVGWLVLIGILTGASFPVTVVMAQESWPRGVGLASSMAMGLGWLPGGVGASVTGLVADQTSLTIGLQLLALAPLLGLVCALVYAGHRAVRAGQGAGRSRDR